MNSQDIHEIQSFKNYPAISLFAPISHDSPEEQAQAPVCVKKLMRQVEDRLLQEFSPRSVEPLWKQLEAMAQQIDYHRAARGVALYVSTGLARTIYLPFSVHERWVIDETFATRDLVYAITRRSRYRLLLLNRKETRLFEGACDKLIEVENEVFPFVHEESGVQTEWTGKIPPFAPHGGVDPDQYRMRGDRNFFHRVDEALAVTTEKPHLPLVLAGVEHNIGLFEKVSRHNDDIIAQVSGNFDDLSLVELGQSVWPRAEVALGAMRTRILNRLEEAIGAHQFAGGIQEVWTAAQQGAVDTLLVEEDFYYPAVLDNNRQLIPAGEAKALGIIDDAVDDLMEAVLLKKGHVAFFDTGQLQQYDHIAAILRY